MKNLTEKPCQTLKHLGTMDLLKRVMYIVVMFVYHTMYKHALRTDKTRMALSNRNMGDLNEVVLVYQRPFLKQTAVFGSSLSAYITMRYHNN